MGIPFIWSVPFPLMHVLRTICHLPVSSKRIIWCISSIFYNMYACCFYNCDFTKNCGKVSLKIFYLPSDSRTESSESILDWNAAQFSGDKLLYRQISSNHGLQSDARTGKNKSESRCSVITDRKKCISEMTGY